MFASQKNKYTVVVVTFDSVARVDLQVGESLDVVRSFRTARPSQAELGEAVRQGLSLGPEECGQVFVLSDEFWTGRVSLSREIVDAVPDNKLDQTLALEVENESGISPFESRVGLAAASSADGVVTWSIVQADAAQLDGVTDALPSWVDQVCGFASVSSPASADGIEDCGMDTTTADACSQLVRIWIENLLSSDNRVPVIRSEQPAWSDQRWSRVRVLATVVVAIVCLGAYLHGARRLSQATDALAQVVAQEQDLWKELGNAEERSRKLLEVKQQQVDSRRTRSRLSSELRRQELELAQNRERPVQILRALAVTADHAHLIQKIEIYSDVLISGVAVDSGAVTSLAERFESSLDSSVWLVQPAAMSIDETTRLVQFKISVSPITGQAERLVQGRDGASHVH